MFLKICILRLVQKICTVLILFFILSVKAQTQVKINAPFVSFGIFNASAERSLNKKISLQAEVFISPWKSFSGKNLQIYMGTLEGRYYFGEVMKKWHLGIYGSVGAFNLQKWNYFNPAPVVDENGVPELLPDGTVRVTDRYQKGLAFILGISGGYHFIINDKLGIDVFGGVGLTQSLYKGYLKDNGERYDGAKNWNKSGEIIPTRGGVMITYIL